MRFCVCKSRVLPSRPLPMLFVFQVASSPPFHPPPPPPATAACAWPRLSRLVCEAVRSSPLALSLIGVWCCLGHCHPPPSCPRPRSHCRRHLHSPAACGQAESLTRSTWRLSSEGHTILMHRNNKHVRRAISCCKDLFEMQVEHGVSGKSRLRGVV